MTECRRPAIAPGSAPRYSRKRIAIMSTLASCGHAPWGAYLGDVMPLRDGRYVLCCGHAWSRREADAFLAAGLVEVITGGTLRQGLIITAAGRAWLRDYWLRPGR